MSATSRLVSVLRSWPTTAIIGSGSTRGKGFGLRSARRMAVTAVVAVAAVVAGVLSPLGPSASASGGTVSAVGGFVSNHATGLTSVSVDPQAVGDLMVLSVLTSPSVTVSSVSGGGVGSWSQAVGYADGWDGEIWYGGVTSAGSSTISVSFSGSVSGLDVELSVQEFTAGLGSGTSWAVDHSGYVPVGSSSTSVMYPALSPSGAGELYFGLAGVSTAGTGGSTSGFTYDATAYGNQVAYDSAVSSPGSYQPVGTMSPAGTSMAVAALFTAASTVGPNPTSDDTLQISSSTVDVSTFAGSSTEGTANGYGSAAQFYNPGPVVALGGYLYLQDGSGGVDIRKINLTTGQVSWLTGGSIGYCNDSTNPVDVGLLTGWSMTTGGKYLYALDHCGPNDSWWIRQIDPNSGATTTLALINDTSYAPQMTTGPDNAFYVTSGLQIIRVGGATHSQSTYVDLSTYVTPDGLSVYGVDAITSDSSHVYVGVELYNPQTKQYTSAVLSFPGGMDNPPITVVSEGGSLEFGGGHFSVLVSAGPYLYYQWDTGVYRVKKSDGASSAVFTGNNSSSYRQGTASIATLGDAIGFTSDGTNLWATQGLSSNEFQVIRVAGPVNGAAVTSGQLNGGGNPAQPCNCTALSATNKGKRPVNDETGDFWHRFTDLSIPGRGPALDFTRTYNSDPSALAQNGLFGPGWSFSYGMSLSVNGSTVTVTQENGSQVNFTENGGRYTPTQSDTTATLSQNPTSGAYTFTRDATQIFTFNSAGEVTGISDLNGYTTTVSYPTGEMVITDPAGRTLTATISGGHIVSLADQAGRTVSYGYDANGNLTSVTDVNSGITSFGYDSSHRMVEMRTPRYYTPGSLPTAPSSCAGSVPADITTMVYDSSGRVICQWDPDGNQTSYVYTGTLASGSTEVTDPKGNITVDYFTAGLLTSETQGYGTPQAATWTFGYDPISGGTTSVVDPDGNTTQYFYDSNGNLVTKVDPLGRATTYTYNVYNEVTSVTPPATYGSAGTVTTTYSYDEPAYSSQGAGNLTTVSTPILSPSGTSEGTQVTHYLYCATSPTPSACSSGVTPPHPGDVTAMIDPGGNTWGYTYDSYGDKTSETAPATSDNSDRSGSQSNVTKWVYDTATGWMTQHLGPRFVLANPTATSCTTPAVDCTTYTYDNIGRLQVTTDGDGHTTTNHYDPDGNLDYTIDGNNNKTTYTYDPAGQRTATTQAYGTSSAQTTTTDYWPDGTIEDQINAKGGDTHYTYDPLGHLTGVTDPDGRTTGYQYDPLGNLLVRSDPGVSGCTATSITKGCTIYSYNAVSEPTAINYNDPGANPNVTAETYDEDGRRTAMTEQTNGSTTNTVTSTWSYDSLGDLTSATDINGNTVSYGYDSRQDQTSIAYPGTTGTVTQSFDPAGRIQTITDWLGNSTNYTYNADGSLATQTAPTSGTSVVDTSTYDNAGNLTSIGSAQGATAIDSFAYSYDQNSQITSVNATGVPSGNNSYSYTPLQQLAASNQGSYTYDPAGNPTSQPGTPTQSFDPAGQLCWTSSTPVTSPTCANPPIGATSYTYDSRGDRTGATGSAQPAPSTAASAVSPVDEFTYTFDDTESGTTYTPSIAASSTSPATGASVMLTATVSSDVGPSSYGLSILDQTTGRVLAHAGSGTSLSVVVSQSSASTHRYVAQMDTHGAAPIGAVSPPVAVTWSGGFPSGAPAVSAVSPSSGPLAGGTTVTITGANLAGASAVDFDGQPAASFTVNSATRITAVAPAGNSNTPLLPGDITVTTPAAVSAVSPVDEFTYTFDDTENGGTFTPVLTASITTASTGQAVTLTATVNSNANSYGMSIIDQTTGQIIAHTSNATTLTAAVSQTAVATQRYVAELDTYGLPPIGAVSAPTVIAWTGSYPSMAPTVSGVSPASGNLTGGTTLTITGTNLGDTNAVYIDGQPAASFTVNSATQITAITPAGASDKPTQPGNITTTSSDTTYSYNSARQLTSATTPTGQIAYTYNGDGLRMTKTIGGTGESFTWDQAAHTPRLLVDATANSTDNYIYDPNGLPLEQISSNGTVTWYHHDAQGSTRTLTNTTGTITGTATYTPYGQLEDSTGTLTPLGYTGAYTDPETGLLYLINRYYDPTTAQFLTVDPLVDTTGAAYTYAGDDPVNNSDPTGLFCIGSVCTRFDPGAGLNAIVNIGRGASFGLSDKIANWIQPGSSCTVPQNHVDQFIGSAATSVVGFGGVTGLARAAALRLPYATAEGLDAMGVTDEFGNITVDSGLQGQELRQTLLHEAVHSIYTRVAGTAISQATYSTAVGQVFEEWAAETFATGRPIAAFRFALGYLG